MNPAGIDSMRQQRMKQLLGMFSKPTVVNKERTHAVLKRWGPGHEHGGRRAESVAVTRVMRELAVQDPRLLKVAPLAIVEGLVDHWIYKVQECLQVVKGYTDKLDHDLTRPVQNPSVEAATWTPVIARCRKAALALLRRCQVNEMVLSQLCSTANLVFSPSHSKADALSDRALLPFGRKMTMRDIAGHNPVQRLGVLQNQLFVSHTTRVQYKKAEQRLSRLHTILLDRQRLRLLSTQKDIHKYFRTLVTVELVFLPIELWYNLDNLNGITTPGKLQPDLNDNEDFGFTVMGILVWAAVATLLYAIYVNFFERKPETLRMANIASMHRRQRKIRMYRQKGAGEVSAVVGWRRLWYALSGK
ncbi:hypothetical protein BX661DRAFT_170418 [Kickxella alabastrina]|uniref:uncharacterized protein n=1 Tax=Kickxella alabastrina TaxID=61397 RepID=UPI00221EA6D4|nr:uncharacterized protein BX661DRAFT_170418 [Kickxella alabastrina]KAI7830089.1 hypothetical protein BX661DRAFT_170418 [Kickxella alabastrina]